jgi:hypothetical protein
MTLAVGAITGTITGAATRAAAGAEPAMAAGESVWIEAEHLQGIRGFCWPMGQPAMRKTAGHWGLSGPGWAAEWNQGGESGFLSIATGAEDAQAVAKTTLEVPADGVYRVWVRYGDWREAAEPFEIRLEQPGAAPIVSQYGRVAVVDEDNEAKLYWNWAFAWDARPATLKKGPATLTLATSQPAAHPRQIDVIVLTSDTAFRPRIKDRPPHPTRDWLDRYRSQRPRELRPLARRAPFAAAVAPLDLNQWNPPPLAAKPDTAKPDSAKPDTAKPDSAKPDSAKPVAPAATPVPLVAAPSVPDSWQLRTFADRGFVYLWNAADSGPNADWLLSDEPNRVLYPYGLRDEDAVKEFKTKYGGKTDVPIFSDPRVAPCFHGVGAGIFATDPKTGDVNPAGQRFAAWLDKNPQRAWGMMMNYHAGKPVGEKGQALFAKYRDRFVGSIAGESVGYFYPKPQDMKVATEKAVTRRQLVEAFKPVTVQGNRDKYRAVYGRDLDANPYQDVIACLSVGNIAWVPLLSDYGCRTLGYESATATSSLLNMRWAFMRGAARQGGHLTATYRSCNFGDASTIFSNVGSYHSPQAILDNYYSVYSGAGMTWYKFDIWYQYMAGSSMFYHEQGFDEFWQPGGTGAAGKQELQLSPKGKLVDRFLRSTAPAAKFDRGNPYTPVAFLVDYAHGWEPAPFWPNSFKNWHEQPDRFLFGDHERMLEEYFWAAYHPMAAESERPMTGTNEVFLPGMFGDMFDVVLAYPDTQRWRTIDTYPVVIAAGDIELTAAEGQRLAQYVERGGTLLIAEAHLTGPGLAALQLPPSDNPQEAASYVWLDEADPQPAQRFRFRPIRVAGMGGAGMGGAGAWRAIARTADGAVCCAAADRGQGRIVYLSIPRGLGIDRRAVPLVPRLLAHLTRGQMPIEVEGDVQWMVNRGRDGWMVTLINPAGQDKPQQGITATDYRQSKAVTIRSRTAVRSAVDRLLPTDRLEVGDGPGGCREIRAEVLAGGLRIIELN